MFRIEAVTVFSLKRLIVAGPPKLIVSMVRIPVPDWPASMMPPEPTLTVPFTAPAPPSVVPVPTLTGTAAAVKPFTKRRPVPVRFTAVLAVMLAPLASTSVPVLTAVVPVKLCTCAPPSVTVPAVVLFRPEVPVSFAETVPARRSNALLLASEPPPALSRIEPFTSTTPTFSFFPFSSKLPPEVVTVPASATWLLASSFNVPPALMATLVESALPVALFKSIRPPFTVTMPVFVLAPVSVSTPAPTLSTATNPKRPTGATPGWMT